MVTKFQEIDWSLSNIQVVSTYFMVTGYLAYRRTTLIRNQYIKFRGSGEEKCNTDCSYVIIIQLILSSYIVSSQHSSKCSLAW